MTAGRSNNKNQWKTSTLAIFNIIPKSADGTIEQYIISKLMGHIIQS